MITLESHGTATKATISMTGWRAAVDEIVCRSTGATVARIDELVTRERLGRWYHDGMCVALAVGSVQYWIRCVPTVRDWLRFN